MNGTVAPSTSRTLHLPLGDHAIIEHRYIVTAMHMDDDLSIGVMTPQDADHTIEDYPAAVQAELEEIADETLDWTHLADRVDGEGLPRIGRVELSRLDDERLEMIVEWDPAYVARMIS